MCVLRSLIRVSCTHWANIESLVFGGLDAVYLRGAEDMSKLCLADVLLAIYGHNNSLPRSQMISRCASGAGAQDPFPDADTRSPFVPTGAPVVVVLKVTSTEELRIGKILGRRTLAALEPPLAQYVGTEHVLSPGGRDNTCEWRD